MPDIITCRSCDKETYVGLKNCPHCSATLPFRRYSWPPKPKDKKESHGLGWVVAELALVVFVIASFLIGVGANN